MTSWQSFLSRVQVGGALPMSFSVVLGDLSPEGNDESLRIEMTVPCVLTDKDIVITRVIDIPIGLTGDQERASWLHDQVRWFYRHEADEQFKLDGVAVYKPVMEHSAY